MMKLCFALALTAVISACSVHVGKDDGTSDQQGGNVDESLSYDLKSNKTCYGSCGPNDNEHCETTHDFSSHADYCSGLEDVGLNQSCARDQRKSLYEAECGSDFQDIN